MKKNSHATSDQIQYELDNVRGLLRSGRVPEAEQRLTALLEKNRKNPEVLGLLAGAVYLRGDKKRAKKLWKQSLDTARLSRVFFVNLHAFLSALIKDGDDVAAKKQASRKLPLWPIEEPPKPHERDLLIDLADKLATVGQIDSGYRLLSTLSKLLPGDLKALASLGVMEMIREDYAAALQIFSAVDNAIRPQSDLSLLVRLYQCEEMLGDEETAATIQQRVRDTYPVYVAPKSPDHKKNILVIYRSPSLGATVTSPRNLFKGNYPTQLTQLLSKDYHFSCMFFGVDSEIQKKHSPRPDLIINNVVNGEGIQADGSMKKLAEFIEAFDVPVINHPLHVMQATRELTAKIVSEVPGVIVPAIKRFSKCEKSDTELVDDIETNFKYPVIVRTIFKQHGEGMVKVDNHEELLESWNGIPDEFYVSQFVDSRHESGFYRKIRAGIVGDEIVVVRIDYDRYWKIHGRVKPERVKFYRENPHLLDKERRICADPDKELGSGVIRALHEIGRRIPLDIFGIDFDVNIEGEIVFFEANATMNLLSLAVSEVNYPIETENRLLSVIRRYLANIGKSGFPDQV